MKSWEKIIKDKLEVYEVNPPEGSLTDFRQKLEESRNHSKKATRGGLSYIVTAGVAVACLAIVWMMKYPEEITPYREQSSVAKVVDKKILSSSLLSVNDSSTNVTPHINIAAIKNVARNIISSRATSDIRVIELENEVKSKEQPPLIADISPTMEDTVTIVQNNESSVVDFGEERKEEHAIPRFISKQKTWIVSGGVLATTLGGALLASSASSSLGSSSLGSSELDFILSPFSPPNNQEGNPEEHEDLPLDEAKHSMPLKLGLSARWKFTDRWALTSGLEYTRYKSSIKYSLSGTKTQYIHNIDLPVRVDYIIANTRWIEAYLGAGCSIDYCVKAKLGGEKIKKDGISFSLLAAGGVQLIITKHIGVFTEPQISWLTPTSEKMLETYRTIHPLTFSISTGIRYTISR